MLEGIDLTNPNILLSGAAAGADTEFSVQADAYGHTVVNWTFRGHKSRFEQHLYELTDNHLTQAHAALLRANTSLKRQYPARSTNINRLLQRNFYQVRWSERVYAVSKFSKDSSMLGIDGGTAWACQMYVDRFLFDNEPMELCELYMFDQNQNQWFQWRRVWFPIESPPIPSGIYAGIGSRNLKDSGQAAISNLYK